MKMIHWLGALALALGSAQAVAASATVLRNETLRATPAANGKSVVAVQRGASVTVLSKKGGWVKVRSGSRDGWLRLLSVRAGAGGLSSGGFGDVVGAATTRSNPSRVVAVAGLRGLDDEELKAAEYDAAQIARLESYTTGSSQARSFARQGGLVATQVPALPAPTAQSDTAPASLW